MLQWTNLRCKKGIRGQTPSILKGTMEEWLEVKRVKGSLGSSASFSRVCESLLTSKSIQGYSSALDIVRANMETRAQGED